MEPFPSAATLYKKALSTNLLSDFEAAGLKGHAKAQVVAGKMRLAEESFEKAAKWFELAGDPESLNILGIIHLKNGEYGRAFDVFYSAAVQGDPEAQYNLAELYYRGQGVGKSHVLAVKWFRESAEHLPCAQTMLGNMYADGKGVPASNEKALFWWLQAAEVGDEDAQYNAAYTLLLEPGDHSLSYRWLRRLAAKNDDAALNGLGNLYHTGDSAPKNADLAFECYEKSARLGNPNGQLNTALSYAGGYGVDRDDDLAFEWCLKAAVAGLPEAQTQLGTMYIDGQGVQSNMAEAVSWFKKAADQGHAPAQFNLGICYHKGSGVEESYKTALHWYRMASASGMNEAKEFLRKFA